jgi:hypothetical protein
MYGLQELKQMVFVDIETTTQKETLQDLINENPNLLEYWQYKSMQCREQNQTELKDVKDDHEMYPRMAGLYPEWGRVVCISIGQIKFDEHGNAASFGKKSFYGEDEKTVLEEFMTIATSIFNNYPKMQWVGHNVKGFDLPFLIKRAIIHGVKIPQQFWLQKQKPWENCLLDTYEIWKFGGYNSAKLGLLTELLDIPSPKDLMAGPEVNRYFWQGRIEEIKSYCEKDIEASANLMLRLSGMDLIDAAPF